MIGLFVSRILDKPCVWDSHGNTLIFCRQLKKSRFYTALSVTLETVLGKWVDALITVSEKDKQAYEEMGINQGKIHVIPTSVDFANVSKTTKSSEQLRAELGLTDQHIMMLFFGSLEYAPNKEAVDYINEILAPNLERSFPNLRIFIAGRGEAPLNLHRSISMLGFVPNIYDVIRASDICIAPIWSGVGILTKVLDMLASAKPTVVTPLAKDGIPELVDGWNVILASSKEDFVTRTKELLERRDMHDMLGKRARETIMAGYTWDKVGVQLDTLFAKLVRS
jgi:glycosyltransferase involved in cell wall biosynthesis